MALDFDTFFEPHYGAAVEVAPGVKRLTARNPSPFTFRGTNAYIVGETGALAIIDPGPDDTEHLEALLAVIDGRPVSHVLVTHTHRDHSPLARRLSDLTGAPTVAEGPHRPARPLASGEINRLDARADTDFQPDMRLSDGALVTGDGWALRAVHTPGHAANHSAFALEGTGIAFSGDHVMAWSTTIVAPPDGAMADYMASLNKLIERDDRLLLPGHGGPVTRPQHFLRGLKTHRRMRQRAVLARLAAGDRTVPEIVAAIYQDTDPRLHGAAALSVLAHLEDLIARGQAISEDPPSLEAAFRPA